jgi:WhiB family redox-sensing transcriptional regulator
MSLLDDLHLQDPAASWMADAACRGLNSELFFLEKGESTAEAKAVCGACPVADACLAYALNNRIVFGIWGGKSEKTRKKLRRDLVPCLRGVTTVPHATQLSYRRGCRCDGCREANSQYVRLLRHKAAG